MALVQVDMSNCVVVSPRDSMTLGELIAIARECKNFSLRDLERATGISSALLSQIETGKIKNPSFAKVVRITRALGISLDRAASTVR